jgi:8-oxo-dGTP diphosphatase
MRSSAINNLYQHSRKYRRVVLSSSVSSSSSSFIPRAAVSVIVRSTSNNNNNNNHHPSFVLIQRGKEPNLGKWSLPGGSLEWGERTLDGAKRELLEECQLDVESLQWYNEGAIAVTDSIHYQDKENGNDDIVDLSSLPSSSSPLSSSSMVVYHYVIAQCFALAPEELPLIPKDDAADAKWFQIEEIQIMSEKNETTPGILNVLERAESMYQRGCLWLPNDTVE